MLFIMIFMRTKFSHINRNIQIYNINIYFNYNHNNDMLQIFLEISTNCDI